MLPSQALDPEETDTASEDDETPDILPLPLTDIFRQENRTLSKDDLEGYMIAVYDCLTISQAEADFLERSTRRQHRSEVWNIHRKGRLTSSNFHRVATCRASTSPTTLISSIMGYSGTASTQAMSWGIDHEEEARREFIGLEGQNHKSFSVRTSGLIVNCTWPYLGASPDGIVECGCCDKCMLEIKCPYKYRFCDISEALSDKDFCLNTDFNLRTNHRYYYQMQGQLAVADVSQGYFVVWTTQSIAVTKVLRDTSFWDSLVQKLESFFLAHILPELATRRLDANSSSPALYCLCQRTEEGRMIACDSESCTTIWFHFKCVSLKRKPSGKWYCPNCKQK